MISRRQATSKANLENLENGCQLNENMDSDNDLDNGNFDVNDKINMTIGDKGNGETLSDCCYYLIRLMSQNCDYYFIEKMIKYFNTYRESKDINYRYAAFNILKLF